MSRPYGTLKVFTRSEGHNEVVSPEHHEKADHRKRPQDTVDRYRSGISMIIQPCAQLGSFTIVLHVNNEGDHSSRDMYEVD